MCCLTRGAIKYRDSWSMPSFRNPSSMGIIDYKLHKGISKTFVNNIKQLRSLISCVLSCIKLAVIPPTPLMLMCFMPIDVIYQKQHFK